MDFKFQRTSWWECVQKGAPGIICTSTIFLHGLPVTLITVGTPFATSSLEFSGFYSISDTPFQFVRSALNLFALKTLSTYVTAKFIYIDGYDLPSLKILFVGCFFQNFINADKRAKNSLELVFDPTASHSFISTNTLQKYKPFYSTPWMVFQRKFEIYLYTDRQFSSP